MLTVISAIIGLIGSSLPLLIGHLNKKDELKTKIELLRLTSELNSKQYLHQSDITRVNAALREGESLRSHDSSLDGGKFINFMRASVRPIITYLFFFFFIGIKSITYYYLVQAGDPSNLETYLNATLELWGDNEQALFSAIISFWFGNRLILHLVDKGKV